MGDPLHWNCGVLRENFGPVKSGHIVFVRLVNRALAAGPCWWIRPQGVDHFWMAAESYGGVGLKDLVAFDRHRSGPLRRSLVTSNAEQTETLNKGLAAFIRSRPKGSIPKPKGDSHDSIKSTSKFNAKASCAIG